MSKIKTLNKQTDIPCPWKERLNNVNSSKLDLNINKILIKIPASYYMDIDNLTLKFNCKAKYSKQPTQYLRRKTKLEEITIQFQDILENQNNQHSVVLAKEQTKKSMKQKRSIEQQNTQDTQLLSKKQRQYNRQIVVLKVMLKQLDIHMQ